MLNRINQLGLTLAVFAFAGLGTAHAQDENPCGDDMDNPCGDDTGEWEDDSNPCGDANPCGEAAADDGGEAAMMTDDAGAAGHSMVTATGKIKIRAALGINLSADAVGDPVALAPDVVYGAADKLDVGLYHTNMGITGFWTQAGGGLCLIGDACAEVYNGPIGILANYSLAEGQLSVAANGGLTFQNVIDDADMRVGIKLGARVRYMIDDKMGLQIDPSIVVGVTSRELDVAGVTVPYNTDVLFLPVAFMYAVDAQIHAGVQTGIAGPLDGFGDSYIIPLNVAGMYQVDSKLGVGGAFGFGNIAGKGSSADSRNLTLFANYAL